MTYRRYKWTHSQLQTYLQIMADDPDVLLLNSSQPATHVPKKQVTLPIGTPMAATSASHEALHLLETSADAMKAQPSSAHAMVLNALEDGRLERQSFLTWPGLKPQFQEDVTELAPFVLKEPWPTQAIKAMYIKVAGYDFPFSKLDKDAKKVLDRFGQFITPIRRAQDTWAVAEFVPKVIALFDEQVEAPRPQPPQGSITCQQECESGGPMTEVPKWASDILNELDANLDQTGEGGQEGEGEKSEGRRPASSSSASGDEDEDEDEYGEGQAERYERDGITYNADNERNMSLATGANERPANGPEPSKQVNVRVRGDGDTVTGGPTVNQLVLRARELALSMEKLEAKRKRAALAKQTRLRNAGSNDAMEVSETPAPPASPFGGGEVAGGVRLPKATSQALYGIDANAFHYNPFGRESSLTIPLDWFSLVNDKGAGAIGYHGSSKWVIRDLRAAQNSDALVGAKQSASVYASTTNYLARQLRVIMQSQDRRGMRDYERFGLLDPRRAYQAGGGRFDVFRNPPNPKDTRPVVLLTTDVSSSMGGGMTRGYGTLIKSRAFHAMNASIVLASALDKLSIPFEAHGFDHNGFLFKGFNDRGLSLNGLSNIWGRSGGSTAAAEALAVGWLRLLMRPEPRKIIIIVTDGAVAENTGRMAKAIEEAGGILICVGIGTGLRGERYFDHYMECNDVQDLPNLFARLLKKLLPTGWAK